MRSHSQQVSSPVQALTTMGIDVGSDLHVVITEWGFLDGMPHGDDYNANAVAKIVYANTVKSFDQAWKLFNNFNVKFCVVDALPETRKSKEFAAMAPDMIKVCFYKHGLQSREIVNHAENMYHISVSRTMWIDQFLSRFKEGTILLPKDVHRDYKRHITALIKVPRRNKQGEEYFAYDNNGPDHFAHANVYSEIALGRSLGGGVTKSTSETL
jgi:hypothetical protein